MKNFSITKSICNFSTVLHYFPDDVINHVSVLVNEIKSFSLRLEEKLPETYKVKNNNFEA